MFSCVVWALAWPPELAEDEPEEPPHDAANITIAPRIVTTSVIRFMSFYTFLYEGGPLLVDKSRLGSRLLAEFENMLRKRKNASNPTKSKKRASCAHEMNESRRLHQLLFTGVRGR